MILGIDATNIHYGVGIGLLEAMSAGLPIASSFAHRTSTPFLFLGVILVVFKHKYVNVNSNVYNSRNNSLANPSKAEESAS